MNIRLEGGQVRRETCQRLLVLLLSIGWWLGSALHPRPALAVNNIFVWGSASTVPGDLTNAAAIALGLNHSVALRADGTVVPWGYNGSGRTNVPPGLANVASVAAGYEHSLALKTDGTVVAWGLAELTNVPAGLNDAVAIAAGDRHSLALRSNRLVPVASAVPTGDGAGRNTRGACAPRNELHG